MRSIGLDFLSQGFHAGRKNHGFLGKHSSQASLEQMQKELAEAFCGECRNFYSLPSLNSWLVMDSPSSHEAFKNAEGTMPIYFFIGL